MQRDTKNKAEINEHVRQYSHDLIKAVRIFSEDKVNISDHPHGEISSFATKGRAL